MKLVPEGVGRNGDGRNLACIFDPGYAALQSNIESSFLYTIVYSYGYQAHLGFRRRGPGVISNIRIALEIELCNQFCKTGPGNPEVNMCRPVLAAIQVPSGF